MQPRSARERVPWAIPDDLDMRIVNDYPLAYVDCGTGSPVLLLHGSLNDYRSWAFQVMPFSRAHRVIAPSLRHCYPEKWDGRGSDYSLAQHADDIAALISQLELPPVHLVGHSRGGAVALQMVLNYRDRIRTLTLADPRGLEPLLAPSTQTQAMEREIAATFTRLRQDLAAGDPTFAAQRFVDSLGGAGAWLRRTAADRQVFLDNLATACDPGEVPELSGARARTFDFPLLLLRGERSPPRYAAMFDALRACNPALAEPLVVAGAAHAMHRENPEAFNAYVLAHFAAHDA